MSKQRDEQRRAEYRVLVGKVRRCIEKGVTDPDDVAVMLGITYTRATALLANVRKGLTVKRLADREVALAERLRQAEAIHARAVAAFDRSVRPTKKIRRSFDRCPICAGTGMLESLQETSDGVDSVPGTCHVCQGTGRVISGVEVTTQTQTGDVAALNAATNALKLASGLQGLVTAPAATPTTTNISVSLNQRLDTMSDDAILELLSEAEDRAQGRISGRVKVIEHAKDHDRHDQTAEPGEGGGTATHGEDAGT